MSQTEMKWEMKAEEKALEIHQIIEKKRPVIHCITNAVTVNDCANILLAVGASPVMAHHPEEVEEITAGSAALVCNLGAIKEFEAMRRAGRRAHALGHAIVIDPVGVSGSTFRRETCRNLIREIHPTCIRGNYSEIRALIEDSNTVAGVDSGEKQIDVGAMRQYAKENSLILIASGETDVIADGAQILTCERGDPMMARITGSGCMASVMLGAFLSAEASICSALACCTFLGEAGEEAARKTREAGGGTMTFRTHFIDQVYLGRE